jgi:hypothetical protein
VVWRQSGKFLRLGARDLLANVGGYGGVAVYAVGVTAVFIVGGGLLFLVANKRLGHDRSLTAMLRFNDPP